MKKLFLFLSLITLGSVCNAAYQEVYSLNQASYTTTNETVAHISTTTMKGGLFVGVVVDSPSAGGSITFADAWVATSVPNIVYSTFAVLSLAGTGNAPNYGPFYIPFNVTVSSGLTYTTSGNSGGVTIIYKSIYSGR